jgi:hypothetical protein
LPAEIVKEVMEEDDSNYPLPRTWISRAVLNCCQGNPYSEGTAHARGRRKEKWPTTNTVNNEGKENCFDPVCCADNSIESVLKLGIRNTNIGKNFTMIFVNLCRINIYKRD